jgi:hypothetical protein
MFDLPLAVGTFPPPQRFTVDHISIHMTAAGEHTYRINIHDKVVVEHTHGKNEHLRNIRR